MLDVRSFEVLGVRAADRMQNVFSQNLKMVISLNLKLLVLI